MAWVSSAVRRAGQGEGVARREINDRKNQDNGELRYAFKKDRLRELFPDQCELAGDRRH
jgi:hypothetical protein